ncbi:hypothetical protein HELRODRAFT_194561 [Helobdella robusta]|uniref:Uncharacterized protein n=1 Tax=Helobdella robusta TaxID=6412 RepID=T1FW72_HELRO|nr:hypothetical protein HELRODRAFT_194561 [Helobdella robusta]ESN91078.1 hypothetical protein HELRODRAFT_194561 [Helobdella robusta]
MFQLKVHRSRGFHPNYRFSNVAVEAKRTAETRRKYMIAQEAASMQIMRSKADSIEDDLSFGDHVTIFFTCILNCRSLPNKTSPLGNLPNPSLKDLLYKPFFRIKHFSYFVRNCPSSAFTPETQSRSHYSFKLPSNFKLAECLVLKRTRQRISISQLHYSLIRLKAMLFD